MEEEKLHHRMAETAAIQRKLDELAAHATTVEQAVLYQPHIAPADLQALAEFRGKTTVERRRLGKELAASQAAAAAQREALVAEKRKLEIYERLRERATAAHSQAVDRELEALALESFLSKLAR